MVNFVTTISMLFPIFFIVLVVLAVVGFLLSHKFLGYLKERHVEKWHELGSPTVVANSSLQNNLKVLRFLKNGEYLELKDNILTEKARFLWNYGRFYLGYFVILICLFLITLIK